MTVETGTDGVVPFHLLGTVRVPLAGTLEVWRLASYGGGLFVPVKDALAGHDGGTYGGGRYLIDTIKGADLGFGATRDGLTGGSETRLVLDYNFAYNPSCAYDPAWACPLAQEGNTLPVEVPVGSATRERENRIRRRPARTERAGRGGPGQRSTSVSLWVGRVIAT
ncbi:hypothetical protein O159_03880 [Leifsonia xyli subsp. cynodontis DSM 46306]|uniref:DUF1684 domain-containing protein n=1 Tax=Leifsonia xyli subsp. cynodontis DSM 46306 TaxID=1389489 RepID=U3P2Q2_LEIXC|nr:hypothetical protein O159_03880 [Leifsonia xyli subsp. cynodontis DSM 46306]